MNFPTYDYFSESYCLDYRTVYNGYAPTSVAWVPSATHCQFECQKNDRCQFFTFNTTSGQCALKLSKGSVQSLNYAISGPKFCATKKGLYHHLMLLEKPDILKAPWGSEINLNQYLTLQ